MVYTLLDSQGWTSRDYSGPNIVALGGGHGLSVTLRALRHVTKNITAVVTVADDGGSSGRLRQEMNVLPPGDLRMALASLCEDTKWGLTWRDAMQHRFSTTGELDEHALGNLLIVTMWDLLGDWVEGLDWVAHLLGCTGRVLPACSQPLDIEADIMQAGKQVLVKGQNKIAKSHGSLQDLRIIPSQPIVCEQSIETINNAEGIILGPGSWYTSVITHLLVPQIQEALVNSKARKILVLNLSSDDVETEGMSATDHLDAIHKYAPELKFDIVIADPSCVDYSDALMNSADKLGAKILFRQVRSGSYNHVHDPLRLAAALRDSLEGYIAEVGRKES